VVVVQVRGVAYQRTTIRPMKITVAWHARVFDRRCSLAYRVTDEINVGVKEVDARHAVGWEARDPGCSSPCASRVALIVETPRLCANYRTDRTPQLAVI
jgi:hypothetical protein